MGELRRDDTSYPWCDRCLKDIDEGVFVQVGVTTLDGAGDKEFPLMVFVCDTCYRDREGSGR